MIPDRLPVGVAYPAIRGALYLFTLDVLSAVTLAPDPERGLPASAVGVEGIGRRLGLTPEQARHQWGAMFREADERRPLLESVPGDRVRLADPWARRLAKPHGQRW